jgi:NAD(P)-dependent dehydrogenase (short-subunit alcohol dehydrogenase family)
MAVLAEHGRIDNLVNNAGQYMTPLKAIDQGVRSRADALGR